MKISIITASYNYAQYIEETIDSVLNQTYQDWELIIIDDGSSDNSVEIIKKYCEKDSRIKFFTHENNQNKGLKETLLLGLEHSTGEWIAFLESDDAFMPENLSEKIKIIKQFPDVKMVFNKVNFISDGTTEKQKDFEKTQKNLDKTHFPKNMFYDFYINNMVLTFSCAMLESKTLKKADFNTPVDSFLDWWLWIHLAHKNDFYYIPEALTNWRLHRESYIRKSKKPILYTLQNQAYMDIYKKDKSLKLLIFIVYSEIKLFATRLLRFLKRKINL